jgi:hypothetical protein
MTTELGEAIDAYLRMLDFIRNNPQQADPARVIEEIFDVAMMACVTLDSLSGVDRGVDAAYIPWVDAMFSDMMSAWMVAGRNGLPDRLAIMGALITSAGAISANVNGGPRADAVYKKVIVLIETVLRFAVELIESSGYDPIQVAHNKLEAMDQKRVQL